MKVDDELEELLAKNMQYHQPSFIAGFNKGKESNLQSLKEKIIKRFDDNTSVYTRQDFLDFITDNLISDGE